MNIEASTAEIVETTASGNTISVSMTSINDVASFLIAALDLGIENWPAEFRMQGDRKKVTEIVQYAEALKGGKILPSVSQPPRILTSFPGSQFNTEIIQAKDLQSHLDFAVYYQDHTKAARIQELIATEQRRYDFREPNLNALVNVVPTSFWDWLHNNWG